MKKQYDPVEVRIAWLDTVDLITASAGEHDDNNPDKDVKDDDIFG